MLTCRTINPLISIENVCFPFCTVIIAFQLESFFLLQPLTLKLKCDCSNLNDITQALYFILGPLPAFFDLWNETVRKNIFLLIPVYCYNYFYRSILYWIRSSFSPPISEFPIPCGPIHLKWDRNKPKYPLIRTTHVLLEDNTWRINLPVRILFYDLLAVHVACQFVLAIATLLRPRNEMCPPMMLLSRTSNMTKRIYLAALNVTAAEGWI